MIKYHSFFFLLLVLSCVEQGGTIPAGVEFKRTMEFEVNGKKGVGSLVIEPAMHYNIKIKTKARAEEIDLNTCHRHIQIEKSGWAKRKKHHFSFDADSEFENNGSCPIHIVSLDKQGSHEWAIILIRNRTLGAGLFCNGEVSSVKGVSICQSLVGLHQRIVFSSRVYYKSNDMCGSVTTKDNLTFDFIPPLGFCKILFYDQYTKKIHSLTTFGYTDIMRTNIRLENRFPEE